MATIQDVINILQRIETNTRGKTQGGTSTDKVSKEPQNWVGIVEKAFVDINKAIKDGTHNIGKTLAKSIFDILKTSVGTNVGTSTSNNIFGAGAAHAQAIITNPPYYTPPSIEAAMKALASGGGGGEAAAAGGAAATGAGAIIGTVAAVVAFGAAIAAIPPVVQDLAKSILDARFQFGEFSGEMAAVAAQRQVFEIQRSQTQGDIQASSSGHLENAYEHLTTSLDRLQPIWNVLVDILAVLTDSVAATVDLFVDLANLLPEVQRFLALGSALKTFLDLFGNENADAGIPDWLAGTSERFAAAAARSMPNL